jgi:hypothetical protein
MVVADPDEALIEAIAEAIHDVSYLGKQVPPGTAKVLAQRVVEHLGLVEETTPICKSNDMDDVICWRGSRRLVSRWVEGDHGSE